MCLESTSYFGGDGICSSALMVRGSVGKYAPNDGLHEVAVAVGNTLDGTGNTMEWMTGRYDGTNVIKDVSILPAELSGYTLSQVLNATNGFQYTLQRKDAAEGQRGWNCFNNTAVISEIDDANRTVTLSGLSGSGTCPKNYIGYIFFAGAHPDDFQLQTGVANSDVYVANNNFNMTYRTYSQGMFLETIGMASVYVGHNNVYTDRTGVEHMYPVSGDGDAFISDSNVFDGIGAYAFDNVAPNGFVGETFVNDQCHSGGFTGAGSPTHRRAAETRACYKALP
jgi:hypothetical protein